MIEVSKSNIRSDQRRDLFWVIISFASEDKISRVFACASIEYMWQEYPSKGGSEIEPEVLDKWASKVQEKWNVLGKEIFAQDVHYDIYLTDYTHEAECLRFLIEKSK